LFSQQASGVLFFLACGLRAFLKPQVEGKESLPILPMQDLATLNFSPNG
jgi:hypothetical protein